MDMEAGIVRRFYGRKLPVEPVITFTIVRIASPASSLALYWAVVILFISRSGAPWQEELSEPDDARAAWDFWLYS